MSRRLERFLAPLPPYLKSHQRSTWKSLKENTSADWAVWWESRPLDTPLLQLTQIVIEFPSFLHLLPPLDSIFLPNIWCLLVRFSVDFPTSVMLWDEFFDTIVSSGLLGWYWSQTVAGFEDHWGIGHTGCIDLHRLCRLHYCSRFCTETRVLQYESCL